MTEDGLVLKYVLLILVVALVIGTAFTLTESFTGMMVSEESADIGDVSTECTGQTELECEDFGPECVWVENTCVC